MENLRRISFLLLFIATFSCSKEKIASQSDGDYLPLIPGNFSEFDVEKTKFTLSALPEIQQFTIRQVIADSFRDVSNQLVYKSEYYSLDNKSAWKMDSIVPVWRTFDKTMCQENGQVIVKMIFPLANEMVWNGNWYNAMSEKMFRVKDLGKPFNAGNIVFPKTVTIIRQDDSTLLSKNKYIEIYAMNVGLIFTEKIFVQYCNTPDCIGKGIINSGWKEISVIKKYGR